MKDRSPQVFGRYRRHYPAECTWTWTVINIRLASRCVGHAAGSLQYLNGCSSSASRSHALQQLISTRSLLKISANATGKLKIRDLEMS